MNRRKFLQAAAVSGMAACATSNNLCAIESEPVPKLIRETSFRTISYNILAASGYPERPENKTRLAAARKRMAERFAIELAVYEPDMITFQESPAEKVVAKIAEHLGMKYAYFPGGFPGTVITKHEITESVNRPASAGQSHVADLFSRHFGQAKLKVNGNEIIVYTAHLHPGNEELRAREAAAIVASMSADLAAGKNVIFQGDLNHSPQQPEYEVWKKAGLQDSFAIKGQGEGLTCSTSNLRWRIDYVWSAGPLSEKVNQCRVLAEGPFIDHPNDLAGFALSDHLPVMATFTLE